MQEVTAGPIHIALGLHDPQGEYACQAAVMLASVFVHAAGRVCAHVVHNETLTTENKRKLAAIAQRYRQDIRFYPVRLSESVQALGGHVTQGALFRLLLPDLIDADKVIYFDCDIVVNLDVAQLWELDLQDLPVAAALDPGMPEFPAEIRRRVASTGVDIARYFNSGVMVLDLRQLRQQYRLFQQAVDFLRRYPQAVFHDQDALNFLFKGKCLMLDSRYNRIVSRAQPKDCTQPSVWHFAGVKPWLYYGSAMDMLYWKALLLTPWQEQALDRLAVVIARTWDKQNAVLAQAQNALADSARQRRLRRVASAASGVGAPVRWVTLFPETENFHLTKDVGMVPFVMYKHFGYESTLVCYSNGEYPYLDREVQGLKLDFLQHTQQDSLRDGCDYIQLHAKTIDVLHVFHFCVRTFQWILLYKALNPQGKVYLKLDADVVILQLKLTPAMLKVLQLCDLISIETKYLYERLSALWPVPVEYIPNGFYDFEEPQPLRWADKENVICTVGRLGTKQKATEVLLEAFALAASDIADWRLRLIGPTETHFGDYIQRYFVANPQLADRVVFVGEIADKRVLEAEYRKAKIFCLSSIFESFGIVLVEAIRNGCLVISSAVGAAPEVVDNGSYGALFPVGDVERLAALLRSHCANQQELALVCRQAPHFAGLNFHWIDLGRVINNQLTDPVGVR